MIDLHNFGLFKRGELLQSPQTVTIFLFQSHIFILSNLVNLLYWLLSGDYKRFINFENLQIFATVKHRRCIWKKTDDPLSDRHGETFSLKAEFLLNIMFSTLFIIWCNQDLFTFTELLHIFLVIKSTRMDWPMCEFTWISLFALQIVRNFIDVFSEVFMHLFVIFLVYSLWLFLFNYLLMILWIMFYVIKFFRLMVIVFHLAYSIPVTEVSIYLVAWVLLVFLFTYLLLTVPFLLLFHIYHNLLWI